MGNLTDDLDRFLKTDGMRILMESGAIRTGLYEPFTVDDIDSFSCIDLEDLDEHSLEDLLDKAENLMIELEEDEPADEGSEEHNLWEGRLSETAYFIKKIRICLDSFVA